MANHTIVASVAPNTVPDHIGQEYYNSVSGVWYKAIGVSSVADWSSQSVISRTEIITFVGENSKEITLDISDATHFEFKTIGGGITTTYSLEAGLGVQVYVNGAWVQAGYTYTLTTTAGAAMNASQGVTGQLEIGSTYNAGNPLSFIAHGEISTTRTSAIIKSLSSNPGQPLMCREFVTYRITTAKPTKIRFIGSSGALFTGSIKVTKNP